MSDNIGSLGADIVSQDKDTLDLMISLNIINSEHVRLKHEEHLKSLGMCDDPKLQMMMNQQYIMLHLLRSSNPVVYESVRREIRNIEIEKGKV